MKQRQIQARLQQQQNRMQNAERYLDFYKNNYQDYIIDDLRKVFPNNFSVIKNFIRKYPVTERLLSDMSILFKKYPTFQFSNTLFEQFINRSNLYLILPKVQQLVNLSYKVALMPRIYHDKVILDVLTPDRCWVQQVIDYPTQINALYYLADTSIDSFIWSKINQVVKITNQKIEKIEFTNGRQKIISSEDNPFGYIPVV